MKQTTKNSVIRIIAEKLGDDISEVTEESTLYSIGADSLDVVEILIEMESYFGISIPIAYYDAVKPYEITVKEVIDVVENYIKAK